VAPVGSCVLGEDIIETEGELLEKQGFMHQV